MPRTPPGWNTSLTYYAHYWGSALGKSPTRAKQQMRDVREDVSGTWGSADDPLASHTPMAQNAILNRLAKLAAGRIDDWESHVDPTLSSGENYRILLEHGGELPADEKREIREAIAATVDEREQSRAADLLRENLEAIDAGDKQQLTDDIAAEYGEEFVAETLRDARTSVETAAEVTIEPRDVGAATAADVEPAPSQPATSNTTDATADGTTESAANTAEPAGADTTATPTTSEPADPTAESADPTAEPPSLNLLTGLFAVIWGFFKLGFQDAATDGPMTDTQTTLDDY
jgi:hypothetical protein